MDEGKDLDFNNEKVKELLKQPFHTEEEIKFIKESYTGIGGLTRSE